MLWAGGCTFVATQSNSFKQNDRALSLQPGDSKLPPSSIIFRSINGTPLENLTKVIELMDGIEKIIGEDDIVMIKPNVQWWNQGAPNLGALKRFIELVMERMGGFKGEVVILENCHRGSKPWLHGGWANNFERNSNLTNIRNMNELGNLLKERYGAKFSVVHLIDVKAGGKRVYHPREGEGYIYCDGSNGVDLIKCDNEAAGPNYRATIMTYPIFKTSMGTIVDFKNGVWERGAYTGQPMKFINFSACNHHSTYCGMTGVIKNYMGIVDLSGGPDPEIDGKLIGDFYNFHSFPFNKWAAGPERGMLGKAIGTFMTTIRKADLNVTTAEWVGLSSRTDPPLARTRAILASRDPIALDYHAAKYLLFPNSRISFHNPDNLQSPLRDYLIKCAEICDTNLSEKNIQVVSYDFKNRSFQENRNLVIPSSRQWGRNGRAILKYLILRMRDFIR
ncbi:MAG: DUF362 domain-containing protein [Thermodesulfobacteriota bacterium]